MLIKKYLKMSNGMYKITLSDSSTIKLHEDLILKYNLLLTKEIDDELLKELEKENIIYDAYNISLKYISKKLRSKEEIKKYLEKKEVPEKRIDEVITLLENQGYLNDFIYIKSFINDKINLSNDGPYKIKKELISLGFSEDKINEELLKFNRELEESKIDKLINKAIKVNKKSEYECKMKIKNNLINLGYNKDIINEKLSYIEIDDSLIRQKEYDKLYKKYSKKYSGEELEYKIKQAMYLHHFK